MKLSLSRAAEFMRAGGEFDPHAVAGGYSIDSRTIHPGQLFFAVQGERLDGHDYVEAALAKSAVGAVVRRDEVARFPAKAILRCQALTDWGPGRARANVITRAQVAGCYPRHQDILAVSYAPD